MLRRFWTGTDPVFSLLAFGALACFAPTLRAQAPAAAGSFDDTVKPVLAVCTQCHNSQALAGGVDLAPFAESQDSIAANREEWELVLQRVRTGEMPPRGIPRPPEEKMQAMIQFVEGQFKIADAKVVPDPGRVSARRLNRAEYQNTVRDLLDVDFMANKEFPVDDSGDGFDNIADVLTISPVLMEKYMQAAERIAARAIGADPLPKPLEVSYEAKDKTIRRVDPSTIEAQHRVDFDGEYTVRFGMPGERAADAKPVTLGFWMDGKLLKTMEVETKPSGLVYFNPYSEAEMKLYLTEGDHTFRAGFIGDDFVKTLDPKSYYRDKENKFLSMIRFLGPFPSDQVKPSRAKILTCDPNTGGAACIKQIVSKLARRAYRRPVTDSEVGALLKLVDVAKAQGQSPEQCVQLAIQAMLVSPNFLFRIEHDPDPTDPNKIHKIADVELASRLSYFLWSSMPDDQLLDLAEAGKLSQPAVLDAQVKRMLGDPRSSAFADNFSGQWLETRNLDVVKPDPDKFPEWTPDLRDAMKSETSLFFDYILRQNRPLKEFIDAKYTFLNGLLAKYYGIDGVEGPEFRRVELTTDQRGGILTQAGPLTVSSYPTRTSVVIRGKYVLNNILGTPPPPPPPNVPALDDADIGKAVSLREQMEKHRANAVCASCHQRMDPLGFGLENYNAIGKWRTVDGKLDIDSSGTLPSGKTFSTPAELRTILEGDIDQFTRCLTEKMLTYALGRGLQRFDKPTVEKIVSDVGANGYQFQSLVYDIVRSLPFQERRGEVVSKDEKEGPKETARR